ncbi:MAG: glycosyltransferase [Bacteroidales bacterium]|nr:glycosyltransferase [Bacteroidales bacterium]
MKVLQICNKPPYPPIDGGSLAMNSITQGLLAAGCEVKVLTVATDKHPVRESMLTSDYRQSTRFESVHVDLAVHPVDAFVSMMCGESYHVKRYISREFQDRLISILDSEEFDVVHVESVFLTPYVPTIRRHSRAVVVLRAHNVEHLIWRQLARGTSNPLRRSYLKHLALTLSVYEREHINDYDGVVCITERDAAFFRDNGCRKPIVAIPFAVAPEPMNGVDEEPYSLFHLGSMDWMPNVEGVEWLLHKVWPRIHAEVPQARLYLAGRNMPKQIMDAAVEGVSVVGEVPDAMYFIGSKQINIVPLLSGSGIRVKIIEAMSAGKVVISTSVGAEGINYTDGENILIADTPEQFAMQVKRCVEDGNLCRTIGDNAYRFIADNYDSNVLTERLMDFYDRIIC